MNKTLVNTISVPTSRTLAVKESDAVEAVIKQFVKQPDVHTIFIVDEHNKLKGLVKLHYILNWVKLKLGINVVDHSNMRVAGTFHAFEIMKLCQSQTIGDIISPAVSVKGDNTMEQALHLMVQEQLLELPVVDDTGKLTGEIRLTQLLAKLLEKTTETTPTCQL
ncbi:hypothetical protein DGWBC_0994 [Dehalogenimonas sp. WBC-2]|nr:hypothetical protein DGWBC_0994 [Dehalogenimonas sp. WBC-2]